MKNNNDSWAVMLAICIIFIISLPLLMFLSDSYYNFQTSVFSNDNTLLFVNNNIGIYIIFFSYIIILLFIILRVKKSTSTKIMKINFCSFVVILTFAISSFILVCQFFDYTDIGKEGIRVRSNILFTEKNYMWSDVNHAEVLCEHTYKSNTKIVYNIYLNDGTVVEVNNSNDFFNKIIELDDFIKNKKIKIIRGTLEAKDYSDFESLLKSGDKKVSHNAEVILHILNK